MTNNQTNKLAMYSATAGLLKSHAASTEPIKAFTGAYSRFAAIVDQISQKDKERLGKTVGKVAVKDEAEDALVIATMIVSSSLAAYARAKGNTQLRDAARIPESAIRQVRPAEQLNIARLRYDLARANETDLADYGITATMLDDLKSRIDAYEEALKSVASGIAERSGARTAVSDLFIQADEVLKDELDALMQVFRVADPEFYNDYRAARVIRDIGVRHTKNNAAAKPAVTGQPN